MSLLQQYILSLPRDLTVVCGATSFHAHRLLLCAHFEFFSGFASSALTDDSSRSEMHDLPGGAKSLLAIEELLYGPKPGQSSALPSDAEECLLLAAAVNYLQPRRSPPPNSGPSPIVQSVLNRLQEALEYTKTPWTPASPAVLGTCARAVRCASRLPGGMAALPQEVAELLRRLLADMLQHTHDIPPEYKGEGALEWCPENLVLELLRGCMGPAMTGKDALHSGASLTEGPCTSLSHPAAHAPLSILQSTAMRRASSAVSGGATGAELAPRWFLLLQGCVEKVLRLSYAATRPGGDDDDMALDDTPQDKLAAAPQTAVVPSDDDLMSVVAMAETMTMPIFSGVSKTAVVPSDAARATIYQIGRVLDCLMPLERVDLGTLPEEEAPPPLTDAQRLFGRRVQCILNCITDGSVLHVYNEYQRSKAPKRQPGGTAAPGTGAVLTPSDAEAVLAAGGEAGPSCNMAPFKQQQLRVGNNDLVMQGLQGLPTHFTCTPQQQRLLDMAHKNQLATPVPPPKTVPNATAHSTEQLHAPHSHPTPANTAPEASASGAADEADAPSGDDDEPIEAFLESVESFGCLPGAPDLKAVLYFVSTAPQRVQRAAAQQATTSAPSSAEEDPPVPELEAGVAESKAAPATEVAAEPIVSGAEKDHAQLETLFPHLFHDGVFLLDDDAVSAAMAAYAVMHLIAAQWRIVACSCNASLGKAQSRDDPFPLANTVSASVMLAGADGRHPTRQATALAVGSMLAHSSPGSLHPKELDLVRFLLPPCSVRELTLQRPSDYASVMGALCLATPAAAQRVECALADGLPPHFVAAPRAKRVFLHPVHAEAALVFRTLALQRGLRALHGRFVADLGAWAADATPVAQACSGGLESQPLGLWRSPATQRSADPNSLFVPAALVELAVSLLSGAEEASHPAVGAGGGRDPLLMGPLPIALMGSRSVHLPKATPELESKEGGQGGVPTSDGSDQRATATAAQGAPTGARFTPNAWQAAPAPTQQQGGAGGRFGGGGWGGPRPAGQQGGAGGGFGGGGWGGPRPAGQQGGAGGRFGGGGWGGPRPAGQQGGEGGGFGGGGWGGPRPAGQQGGDFGAAADAAQPEAQVEAAAPKQNTEPTAPVLFKGTPLNTRPPFVVAATSCLVMAHELSPFCVQEDVLEAINEATGGVPPAEYEFHYDGDNPYAVFDMPSRQLASRLIEYLHNGKTIGGRKLKLKIVALQRSVEEHAEQADSPTGRSESKNIVMYVPADDSRCSALSARVPSQWCAELGSHVSTAALLALVRQSCSAFSVFAGDVFAHILALGTAEQVMSVLGSVLTSDVLPLGDVSVRLVATALLSLAHAGELTRARALQLLLWCHGALQDTLLVQSSTGHLKRKYLALSLSDTSCTLRTPPMARTGGGFTAQLGASVLTPSELSRLARELRNGCLKHPHLEQPAQALLSGVLSSLVEDGQVPGHISPLQPSVHTGAAASLAYGPLPLPWRPTTPSEEHAVPCGAELLCSEWNTPQRTTTSSDWVRQAAQQATDQQNTAVAVRARGHRATDMLLSRWCEWMLAEGGALPPFALLPSTNIMQAQGGLDWQAPPPHSLDESDPSSWVGAVVNVPESVSGVPRGASGVLVAVTHAATATLGAGEDDEGDQGEQMGGDNTVQGGPHGGQGGGAVAGAAPALASDGMQASIRLLPMESHLGAAEQLVTCPLREVIRSLRPAQAAAAVVGFKSHLPVRGTHVDETGTPADAGQVLPLLPFLPSLPLPPRLHLLQRGALSHAQFTALTAVGALPVGLFTGQDADPDEGTMARTAAFLHGAVAHPVQEHVEAFLAHGIESVPTTPSQPETKPADKKDAAAPAEGGAAAPAEGDAAAPAEGGAAAPAEGDAAAPAEGGAAAPAEGGAAAPAEGDAAAPAEGGAATEEPSG